MARTNIRLKVVTSKLRRSIEKVFTFKTILLLLSERREKETKNYVKDERNFLNDHYNEPNKYILFYLRCTNAGGIFFTPSSISVQFLS